MQFFLILTLCLTGACTTSTRISEQGAQTTMQDSGPGPGTICGTSDDRALSSDSRVGRLSFVSAVDPVTGVPTIGSACTAWLVANGTVLTAGHCVDFDPDGNGPSLPDGILDIDDDDLVEFQPPASLSDGTLQPAPAERRYGIDLDSVAWTYGGEDESPGNDWAVFRLLPNEVTEKLAGNVQGGMRVSDNFPELGTSVRVTGHGTDMTPNGTRNQAQQSHNGPLLENGPFDTYLSYEVDTTGGNSGSPIIWEGMQYALGIHTTGGCDAGGGANSGTAFNHYQLRLAIDFAASGAQGYEATGTLHVDRLALFPVEQNGSLFRPFVTLGTAHAAAADGQKISLMAGNYENDTVVLDKRVLIVAPVGAAVVGE